MQPWAEFEWSGGTLLTSDKAMRELLGRLENRAIALRRIQAIVHQKTAKTEPALHHFQRDFDEIRKLCEEIVGPYQRVD